MSRIPAYLMNAAVQFASNTNNRLSRRADSAWRSKLGLAVLVASSCIASIAISGPAWAQGLTPQPIQTPGFPTPAATINGWVASGNAQAIRDHGWALWQGATAMTPQSQGWPVWETWYTDTEVSAGPATTALRASSRGAARPTHQFHPPRQFDHIRRAQRQLASPLTASIGLDEQVVGFNKFNVDYAQHIWNNKYQQKSVLWALQNSWGTQPVINRHVAAFPAPAIGLKPVFEVVRGPTNNAGITLLNYWLGDLTTGPNNSTNPKNPTSATWKQCVIVNTGTAAPPAGLKCPNGGTPSGTVSQKDFYSFQLNADEAKAICQAQGACGVKAGDYAVLVAMHFTTRENDNWTWQTFWWNYNQPFPYGAPPASIPAPFNRYAMCSAYSMTTNPPNSPTGTNTLCYNPYLEPSSGIPDGIHSNCMSCHSVASYGNNPNNPGYPLSYSPTAYISNTVSANDMTYFDCQTTSDTSWFLAGVAGNPPGPQPKCVITP